MRPSGHIGSPGPVSQIRTGAVPDTCESFNRKQSINRIFTYVHATLNRSAIVIINI